MSGNPGTRLVVVPDLDRELTGAFADVEELLLTLRWQETEDPDEPVAHPAALAAGVALQAVRRIADTIRPTQTDPDTSAGPRLLGPDGRYEHVPLRFVHLRAGDVQALSAAAAALGGPVRSEEVTDALEAHAGHRRPDRAVPDPVAALVALVARLAGVLDLAWTEDCELLRARIEPAPSDVTLSAAEEAAYQRTVTRISGMWALGDPVDRFTY